MLGFSGPAMAQFGDVAKQARKATVDTTKDAAEKTGEASNKVGSGVEEGAKKATTEAARAPATVASRWF